MPSIAATSGIWTDTVGLIFTFFVLLPALATVLVIVSIVAARGEKLDDAKVRGRWGRRPSDGD
ncbi:MAG: hypothetical protein ACLGHP_09860 [Vicinamibacteria bacterium]